MADQNTLDAVLARIAQLAGIAPGKTSAFRDSAFFVLCFTEWSAAESQSGYTARDRKVMRAIASAALALDSVLKQRTRRVDDALSVECLAWQRAQKGKVLTATPSRDAFLQWLAWPRHLADLVSQAHCRESKRRRHGKRGAPAGFRNPVAYKIATGLQKAAREHGGKLTIDKTLGAGSLLTALELCKPFVSPTFRIPSAMTLDRMIRKKPRAVTPEKSRRSKKRKSPAKKANY